MTTDPATPDRPTSELHGWKEIAAYLGRSVRAVQRWELELGLPVHRIKTSSGQVIYARRDEIDAWRARQEIPPKTSSITSDATSGSYTPPLSRRWRRFAIVGAAMVVAIVGILLITVPSTQSADGPITYKLTENALVASREGRELWRHVFPRQLLLQRPIGAGVVPWPPERIRVADLDGDGETEVVAAVSYTLEEGIHGDELYCFSAAGDVRWVYRPEATLHFRAGAFTAPWYISAFAVSPGTSARSVYVAVSHNVWWPSALMRIRPDGTAEQRFVHSGHLYAVTFWSVNGVRHVLAGGINNEFAAASLAVLREDAGAARSPQAAGSQYECVDCSSETPVRYYLFERTELNRIASYPYNRVMALNVVNGTVHVHTEEDPHQPSTANMFRISPDFQVIAATPGDGYWHRHRQQEEAGRLRHRAEECGARSSEARTYDRAAGWSEKRLSFAAPLPGATQ